MAKKETKDKNFPTEENIKLFTSKNQISAFFGSFLVLFAIGLLIAMVSFIFYWTTDQDIVYGLGDRSKEVQNLLGKFGAILSHFFIYESFGLASFIFVKLFFITGLFFLFQTSAKRLKKIWFWDLFLVLIISITMGFFHEQIPNLGGIFGFEMNDFIQDYLGKTGAILLIILTFFVFLFFKYNVSPEQIKDYFDKSKKSIQADLSEISNARTTTDEKNLKNAKKNHIKQEVEEDTDDFEEPFIIETKPNFEIDKEKLKPTISNASELVLDKHKLDISNKIDENEDDFTVTKLDIKDEEVIKTDDSQFVITKSKEEKSVEENLASRLVADFGEFDPTLELSNFKFPTLDLLKDYNTTGITINQEELEENKNKIIETLRNYKIEIAQIKATIGPSVTLYEIVPEAGIRISKIKSLEDDIALSLAALGIRIIAPMPGKGTIGIEVPNKNPTMVPMKTVISSPRFQAAEMELPIALGKTISNETFVFDLAKMPHLLMAGATGQGKSVGLNAVLTSLLYKKHPAEVKFVLVDPKKVELTLFNQIERHYLAKLPDTEEAIITDNNKVVNTLNSLCIEMDDRYSLLKDAMVRNIKEYNEKFKLRKLNPELGHRFLPYIVLVVDEFADLIMTAGKEVEVPIARLAQLARAIGIHLIIATQRPSVNVITGLIKANFPGRIAFRVTSKIDSRTILDTQGADQLIGKGDLLFTNGNDLIRVQCAFVDTPEVERICEYIGNQRGYADAYLLPEYSGGDEGSNINDIDLSQRDTMFREAAEVIIAAQQGSASLLQRKLKLGYNRAGRIIDQLEAAGIVGPFEGSKARSVNFIDLHSLQEFLDKNNY
jgi:DNA segregation ATPase FtsK/SpoIIIE, S-DNA-T family